MLTEKKYFSYQDAEVCDRQSEQVDVHDPLQLGPGQDDDAQDVADDADADKYVGQDAVREPVDEGDHFGLGPILKNFFYCNN